MPFDFNIQQVNDLAANTTSENRLDFKTNTLGELEMKKFRILQFPVRNTSGGVTEYALNNWKNIDKKRFQFDFATLGGKLDFEEEVTAQGCAVHYVSCSAESDINQFVAEFNAILEAGYDAVHLHTGFWKSFAVEELAKAKKIPVIIIHSHSSELSSATPIVNREEAKALHNMQKEKFDPGLATHFCACSRLAAGWLFGPQIPLEKIQVLPPAIDVDRFSYFPQVREHHRRELGLERNFVIGHVARFAYEKNHDFLIDVFAEVSKQIPNAKLILKGIGALFDEVKSKVQRLGLSDKVLFLVERRDMSKLYQAMDLFVLPSRFEGLPQVMLEAQCSGLKCYASESITDEVKITDLTHFLPLSIDAWSNEIIETAHKNYVRRDRSAEVAAAGYSIKEQIKVLERIYAGDE